MPMHPLGQLITDRMSHPDNQWSLQRVVDQMEVAGYRGIIGKSRLAQIRREPVESIKGEVIFALAAGLGVTPLTVANAALASMGIESRSSEVTDSVATVRIDPTLSDSNRELLITMIRQMRAVTAAGPNVRLVAAGPDELITETIIPGETTPLRPVPAANPDAPPTQDHAAAARATDPDAGKGRSEQGDAPDGGA